MDIASRLSMPEAAGLTVEEPIQWAEDVPPIGKVLLLWDLSAFMIVPMGCCPLP